MPARRSARTHPRASAPEIPRYEGSRGPGSTAEVHFWTAKDVREVLRCHLNYVVADTGKWEQTAAYLIDTHPAVAAFVKNEGMGFAIRVLPQRQDHEYFPDFIVRLKGDPPLHLILETKGYDPLEEIKRAAAERWVRGRQRRWTPRSVALHADQEGVGHSRSASQLPGPWGSPLAGITHLLFLGKRSMANDLFQDIGIPTGHFASSFDAMLGLAIFDQRVR